MKQHIDSYIASKKHSWADSTLRSERHRLNGIAASLDGNPQTLWSVLAPQTPYGRVTTWVRVCAFWDFYLTAKGDASETSNPYREFQRSHARFFKNTYDRNPQPVEHLECRRRIAAIKDASSRTLAEFIFKNGLRYTESGTLSDGQVTGKGNKKRLIFSRTASGASYPYTYQTFLRHLDYVGLKPHDLRKAFASRLVEEGANPFELMELMGWNDLRPALSYVNSRKEKLRELVRKVNM